MDPTAAATPAAPSTPVASSTPVAPTIADEKPMSVNTTLLENIGYVGKSIKTNFLSWVCIFIAVYVLSDDWQDYGFALLSFLGIMITSHIVHYLAHFTFAYPLNIVHIYHHKHSNSFSHLIQAALEFAFPFSVVAWKYMVKFLLEVDLSFINFWVVFLYYLFYTTVHNINYGIVRVNDVHALHHRMFVKNMGPDVCDIAFGTKHDVTKGVENTLHYIPNIVLATAAVYFIKKYYRGASGEQQALFNNIGMGVYGATVLLLAGTSIYLYAKDRHKLFYRNYTAYYGQHDDNGATSTSTSAATISTSTSTAVNTVNETSASDGQTQLRRVAAKPQSQTSAL